MGVLQNKIDFSMIITAKNANPNGDPLNGNRPRENYDGFGEISDVCIKRKIRNRLQDMGEKIFVQSNDNRDDEFGSMKERVENNANVKALGKKPTNKEFYETVCKEWIDVRSFGQVFGFKDDESKGSSIGVRGPVSIHLAQSISPIEIESFKIAPSANNKKNYDKEGKDKNTLGDKHFVRFGLYVINGSINCQLAEKTGFTDEDAEKIKQALLTLFENDTSSARPDGSMEVCRLYWWKHEGKTPKYSSAKVHRQLEVKLKEGVSRPASFDDYDVKLNELEGLYCEKHEDLI
ncbi:type I-C CRISPR-associated protein Cas7/Csd2 [Ruminococcus sp. XPD3002]|uniref:type I-C CRISPR-associated protein Cas7/Csd2 n=1 Tax=Ruminococcus sp. XPD3002 TaxID=1452269 RepID=UPI00091C7DAE|nr:CRISPR-associated protein Csd2 [Ruminococcus flavefaciens]